MQPEKPAGGQVQQFATGATRSSDDGKNDYEGFLSPLMLEAFGDYMTKHRVQADGQLRASDNWQKGIPPESYRKAFVRHSLELWSLWRGHTPKRVAKEMPNATREARILETALAVLFNLQGFIHEFVKPPVPNFQTYQFQPGQQPFPGNLNPPQPGYNNS